MHLVRVVAKPPRRCAVRRSASVAAATTRSARPWAPLVSASVVPALYTREIPKPLRASFPRRVGARPQPAPLARPSERIGGEAGDDGPGRAFLSLAPGPVRARRRSEPPDSDGQLAPGDWPRF